MQPEHPRPSQIWKYVDLRVRVLDMSRDVITFQGRSRRGGVTRDNLSNFLQTYRRASG